MQSNQIKLINILSNEEYSVIDNFCNSHQGEDSLTEIAKFLDTRFSLNLILDQSIVDGYKTDGSNLPGKARALCRPVSERECSIIMRVCYSAKIPLTISAGKSNITGSATPEGGIILSVVKLKQPPVSLHKDKLLASSPVGLILEDVRNEILKLSDKVLEFPVNPTSRKDAMLGGALSTNASGFTPGTTGSIRNWVNSIDFILPNGKKITAKRGEYISENANFILLDDSEKITFPIPQYPRPRIKNASGPLSSPNGKVDFVEFMIGSEGIFGLITKCELVLQKRPNDYLELFFSLPKEKNAIDFLNYISKEYNDDFSSFSAFEYFGLHFRKHMKYQEKFFMDDNEVGIYLQLPIFGNNFDEKVEYWFNKLISCGCEIKEDSIMLLDNDREKELFLESRHSVPSKVLEIVQQRETFAIITDTVVPLNTFPIFLNETHNIISSEGIDYVSFGHFGDCHLHFCLLPEKKHLQKASEVYDAIVAKSAELGGTYSGEHGTGKRKHKDFIRCYGNSAVEQVRQSKKVIDPNFILNRGNVIDGNIF